MHKRVTLSDILGKMIFLLWKWGFDTILGFYHYKNTLKNTFMECYHAVFGPL